MARPLLLVTNDDGVDAPGLWDLVRAVDGLGDVAVVAPAREQSWAGRAHRSDSGAARSVTSSPCPPPGGAPEVTCCVAVTSTPARCVRLALTGLRLRPALLLAGINPGTNGGAMLTTSGTLGAAWEAAGDGVPAVAFSRPEPVDDAQTTLVLRHVRAVTERVLAGGLPPGAAVLNVNLPVALRPGAGWVVTTTSTASQYGHAMTSSGQPDGTTRWDLRFHQTPPADPEPGSDLAVVRTGDVSLTFVPARHGLGRGAGGHGWSVPEALTSRQAAAPRRDPRAPRGRSRP